MPALPSDYDSDPARWRSCERGAQVFGDVHAPVAQRIVGEDLAPVLTHLPDRDAVLRYCGSHSLHPDAADRVTPPVWLTKRGCVVYASEQ
jgi:hypothetical protein